MTGGQSRGLAHVRPREVSGFAQAAAAGRVPPAPPTPPRPLPGPSADRMFNVWVLKIVAGVAALLVTLEVVERLALPGPAHALVVLGLFAALAVWIVRGWWAVGDRNLEELAQGYTTLVLTFGFFRSVPGSRFSSTAGRVPWDYTGIWVLAADGSVKSVPDRSVEPPGFYPSPSRPGQDELWTGAAWSGQYRSSGHHP